MFAARFTCSMPRRGAMRLRLNEECECPPQCPPAMRDSQGKGDNGFFEIGFSSKKCAGFRTIYPAGNVRANEKREAALFKQKGRKALQDSAPANWERQEEMLSPLNLKSENPSESRRRKTFARCPYRKFTVRAISFRTPPLRLNCEQSR